MIPAYALQYFSDMQNVLYSKHYAVAALDYLDFGPLGWQTLLMGASCDSLVLMNLTTLGE